RQRFPNATGVRLIWGKGIKTRSGVATAQDQTLAFKTRKVFEATFRCERDSPPSGCIPLTPLSIVFSEPIAAEIAKQITLTAPDGSKRTPDASANATDQFVSEASFRGPFKE